MKPRSEKIGEVTFLSEQMAAAREMSSCCVGVEAHLEKNAQFGQPPLANRLPNPVRDSWARFVGLIKIG